MKEPVILPQFKEISFLSTYFRKTIKYQISLKFIQWEWSFFNADRKANRHDDANSHFSHFFEGAEGLHIMQILVSFLRLYLTSFSVVLRIFRANIL